MKKLGACGLKNKVENFEYIVYDRTRSSVQEGDLLANLGNIPVRF